jgi:glycosyltransferase involved in cell wall biosynthesis
MKTVSVIIPAYNHAPYLRAAIDSALAQTYAPHEVIVVDDGSTDETPQILASYGDRIRAIRQPNGGVASARNAGIAAASGDYLAFLDSDDLWEPRKLELQMARFDADPSLGLIHCGAEAFDNEGRTLQVWLDGMEGWVANAMLCLEGHVITCNTIVIPKRVAEEIGPFDGRLTPSEDWDFCYRVAVRYPVGYVPEILLRYRQHGAGIHLNIERMEHGMLLALQKAFDSSDPAVQSLRRASYGRLHFILAGCYFHERKPLRFVRHMLQSARYDPRRFAVQLSRKLTSHA